VLRVQEPVKADHHHYSVEGELPAAPPRNAYIFSSLQRASNQPDGRLLAKSVASERGDEGRVDLHSVDKHLNGGTQSKGEVNHLACCHK
jgi:hypothetical protein